MQSQNRKIIDAIIAKATRDCPGSLAMIGIYGSFCTGDIHEKSDLDLMILINDEKGYCLSHTFLLEDTGVAHDLYCTTWESLENDATFPHPHLSKLMDSQIVYCADEAYRIRLNALKAKAASADSAEAARETLKKAKCCYADAMLATELAQVRYHAVGMILNLMDAIALRNGRYFHLGTRRVFQELGQMPLVPNNLKAHVDSITAAETVSKLKDALLPPLQAVEVLFDMPQQKAEPYPGTCEEMLSNWRNKMYLAVKTEDRWLSMSSMASLDAMLKELGYHWNVLEDYRPDDLTASAQNYDTVIDRYRAEYEKAGIPFQSYRNADSFIEAYLKEQA